MASGCWASGCCGLGLCGLGLLGFGLCGLGLLGFVGGLGCLAALVVRWASIGAGHRGHGLVHLVVHRHVRLGHGLVHGIGHLLGGLVAGHFRGSGTRGEGQFLVHLFVDQDGVEGEVDEEQPGSHPRQNDSSRKRPAPVPLDPGPHHVNVSPPEAKHFRVLDRVDDVGDLPVTLPPIVSYK